MKKLYFVTVALIIASMSLPPVGRPATDSPHTGTCHAAPTEVPATEAPLRKLRPQLQRRPEATATQGWCCH